MKLHRLILLTPVFFLMCCNPEKIETKTDAQGTTIQLSPVWRSSVSDDNNRLAGDIGQAIVTDRGILFPKGTAFKSNPQSTRSYAVFKDKDTGQDIWTWNDFLTDFERFDLYKSWQDVSTGVLLHTSGNRGYGIDLNTGKTLWRKTYVDRWANVSTATHNGLYFTTVNSDSNDKVAVKKPEVCIGQLADGSFKVITSLIYGGTAGQAGGGYKQFFGGVNGIRVVEHQNEKYLLFDYFDSTHPTMYWYTPRMSLYNLTQKKFVYEGLAMKEAGYLLAVNGHLQVNNGKVYDAIDRFTVCHDLLTGKQLWERTFGSWTDHQLAYDDKLLAYITDGNLYCLDANTGQTRWRIETVVTSNFAQLNGVVYFAARKALWAVEGDTGKVLWKIESPDMRKNDNAVFKGFVAAVPGKAGQKGRVYAHTGLNAYCYEAIR